MSRDVRRMPLDFDWPLNKVWSGYLMPAELSLPSCPDCYGQGWSRAGRWLNELMHQLGMLADDVVSAQPRGRELHPWLAGQPHPPTFPVMRAATESERAAARRLIAVGERTGRSPSGYYYRLAEPDSQTEDHHEVMRPDDTIVDLVAGLSGTSRERLGGFLGISSSETYSMARTVIAAAGLDPDVWGQCATCEASGSIATPEQKAAHEAWEPTEPPTGPGWQLWETVSEGSPISPVFPDAEGLITWLTTDYTWGAQYTPLTRAQAEAFVDARSSIGSFVGKNGTLIDGVVAVSELNKEQ